jgi:hypothetical protein
MSLQQPLVAYPTLDETVDATSTVTFYLVIRGTQCVKYTIYIYDIATNTLQYSDTQTLASTLYDGDQLNISVNMSALGADSYYWYADLYYDSTNYITTYAANGTFVASTPPTCTFSPSVPSLVTSPSREFIASYNQSEGIPVKSFIINLYDGTYDGVNDPKDHLLATSGENTTSPNNIRYTFNGLISGQSYKVQASGYTDNGVAFSTPLTSFAVSYVVPTSQAQPTATLNSDTSVEIVWSNIVDIEGTTSGTVSYESDFLYAGNQGLNMAASAYVEFELDFTPPFTKEFAIVFPSGYTGIFSEISDTAGVQYIYFGYDGTRFYINVNGDYYYATSEVLTTNPYIVGVRHDGISISMYTREVVI